MGRKMTHNLFYSAKAVEYMSRCLGLGKFEVGDTWKCQDCLHEQASLCTDCKEEWLHEVTHLDYSDAFERRLNITFGTAACVMGITGALANASMELWEESDVMKQINEGFKARLPELLLIAPTWKNVYNSLLIILLFLSISAIIASVLVATFLMAMNPRAKRHWKHMTAGVYLVIVSQIVAYNFLLISGVGIVELAYTFGPVILGCGALLCVVFMRQRVQTDKAGEVEKGL